MPNELRMFNIYIDRTVRNCFQTNSTGVNFGNGTNLVTLLIAGDQVLFATSETNLQKAISSKV